MGFPIWTLWGTVISTAAALLFVTTAYLAQSPDWVQRHRRWGPVLAARSRTLTGYGLAAMLLALGFFLAGVPIAPADTEPTAAEVAAMGTPTLTPTTTPGSVAPTSTPTVTPIPAEGAMPAPDDAPTAASESGAFVRPSGSDEGEDEDGDVEAESAAAESATESEADVDETATPRPTATPSSTPTASPTPTNTPTPTATPSPTITPTPIVGTTAVIDSVSSTLWMRRTPGGAQLVLMSRGDTVLVEGQQANQGGILWQQARTLDGTLGWVQAEFLDRGDGPDDGAGGTAGN